MTEQYTYRYKGLSPQEITEEMGASVHQALHAKYGQDPDPAIARRIEEEWAAIERTDSLLDIAALYELTTWLRSKKYPYRIRGASGSSFILYLLGIADLEAWRAMEQVRKGKGLPDLDLPELTEREKQVLGQCRYIDYLYPKAHAVEHILYALKARDYF